MNLTEIIKAMLIALAMTVSGCNAKFPNCDLSDSDCKFPDNYAYGIVNNYYANGDVAFAVKIIRAHGGFEDSKFFPVSMNIMINQALLSNDKTKFDKINQYLSSFEIEDDRLGAKEYIDIVAFFRDHNGAYISVNQSGRECPYLISNLEDVNDSASQIFTKAYFEYAVWYSLYVNSKCATPATRAIYIANLSQLDLSKAVSALQRMNEELVANKEELALMRGRICRIGKDIDIETRGNGIYALHQDGHLKCNQWSKLP